MPSPLPRDEPRAGREGASTRCPTCGRRAAGVHPVCPAHGFIRSRGRSELDFTVVSGGEHPWFPGYRTRRILGSGGFGTVFEAEPEAGGPTVAIKLAREDHPEAALRLVHEARVLKEIGPPHVPAVYELGSLEGGSPYVVMEYVEAPTLAELLVVGSEPIPIARAVALSLSILAALE